MSQFDYLELILIRDFLCSIIPVKARIEFPNGFKRQESRFCYSNVKVAFFWGYYKLHILFHLHNNGTTFRFFFDFDPITRENFWVVLIPLNLWLGCSQHRNTKLNLQGKSMGIYGITIISALSKMGMCHHTALLTATSSSPVHAPVLRRQWGWRQNRGRSWLREHPPQRAPTVRTPPTGRRRWEQSLET